MEQVFTISGRGAVVLARPLTQMQANFTVREGATLNGCELLPGLAVPRLVSATSQPRLDLFAFTLRHAADLAHFSVGQQVILAP